MRFTIPFHYILFLKFWLNPRNLLSNPNHNRTPTNLPLHIIFRRKVLFCRRNHARNLVRLSIPIHPHKRSLCILLFYLFALISRIILFQFSTQNCVNKGSNDPNHVNGNLFFRLRTAMRPDVLLGCSCNYEPFLGGTFSRSFTSKLDLRRVFRESTDTHSFLLITFLATVHFKVPCNYALVFSS